MDKWTVGDSPEVFDPPPGGRDAYGFKWPVTGEDEALFTMVYVDRHAAQGSPRA